ncbi:MAG: hypothetical protein OHK93_001125 [Ramalina farinacea]|uniref:Uncharacterized protein n=1 Tax=Ramalina farinacea TaxID=258253 RepID=A0AA43QRQ0_9LECA|nr:hypothetical protein [Ramalina farinacea]
MSEYSLTEIAMFAVEDLAWPFYYPDVLRKFKTLAIFTGIYGVAFLCNVQHWITGLSNNDRSLDVVLNMKTRMRPFDVLSFIVIVVGVAVRSLIILNLVYVSILQMSEILMVIMLQDLFQHMEDKKKRTGWQFQKRDVFELCQLLKAERWAQDQLWEQSPGVIELVGEIYKKLGMKHIDADLLSGNEVEISGITLILPKG